MWHGAGDVRVEDVNRPAQAKPGNAIVQVAAATICASDLAEFRSGPHTIPTSRPHALTGQTAPVTLGHEYSGVVVEIGQGVTNVAVGDRVCGDSCIRCHKCYWCLRGEYNICQHGGSVGFHMDGAFASHVELPAYVLERLTDGVSDRAGAVVEPLAVGLHAIERGGVRPGDVVVVLGFGMIGAASTLMANAAGAGAVYVLEGQAHRQELARAVGATDVLDPGDPDVRRQLRSRTATVGGDVVVDCTGRPDGLSLALDLSRRGGRIAVPGISHEPAALNMERLVYFERQVVGVLGYRYHHQRVIRMIEQGRIRPEPLMGATVPLTNIVKEGFQYLLSDPRAPLRLFVDVTT